MASFVQLKNVTLDIPIYDASRSFRSNLANKYLGGHIYRNKTSKKVSIRALDNISFKLEEGDRLGLVGHNGSGKTTLLRMLCGVYRNFQGTLSHCGRITSLFNMLPGVEMDSSGIHNIYVVGQYLGMTKKDIEAKLKNIIDFSELDEYINLPVRTYSTGMLTRLGFSIATSLEPDILLLDEGIGAGDASFTKKAQARIESFYGRVKIMVVASHSQQLIKDMCNKVVLLEHGKMIATGTPDEIFKQGVHNEEGVS